MNTRNSILPIGCAIVTISATCFVCGFHKWPTPPATFVQGSNDPVAILRRNDALSRLRSLEKQSEDLRHPAGTDARLLRSILVSESTQNYAILRNASSSDEARDAAQHRIDEIEPQIATFDAQEKVCSAQRADLASRITAATQEFEAARIQATDHYEQVPQSSLPWYNRFNTLNLIPAGGLLAAVGALMIAIGWPRRH